MSSATARETGYFSSSSSSRQIDAVANDRNLIVSSIFFIRSNYEPYLLHDVIAPPEQIPTHIFSPPFLTPRENSWRLHIFVGTRCSKLMIIFPMDYFNYLKKKKEKRNSLEICFSRGRRDNFAESSSVTGFLPIPKGKTESRQGEKREERKSMWR